MKDIIGRKDMMGDKSNYNVYEYIPKRFIMIARR